jgi:hypothetical protein
VQHLPRVKCTGYRAGPIHAHTRPAEPGPMCLSCSRDCHALVMCLSCSRDCSGSRRQGLCRQGGPGVCSTSFFFLHASGFPFIRKRRPYISLVSGICSSSSALVWPVSLTVVNAIPMYLQLPCFLIKGKPDACRKKNDIEHTPGPPCAASAE